MEDKEKYLRLLGEFTPPKGYDVKDYYGVSMITIKKNGNTSIELQYDYNKNRVVSSSLVFSDIQQTLEVIRILFKFKVDKTTKPAMLDYI
jgi:hypothetical protein